MLITHTRNAAGQRRVYLGGKGSLEAWIEPKDDGRSWSFHWDKAPTTYPVSEAVGRDWANHILFNLAAILNVPPEQLAGVPFDAIAALHTEDPTHNRRIPNGRHRARETGYLASNPGITVPASDFAPRTRTAERHHAGSPIK